MRLTYPSDIKIIRIPCTGKVNLLHILHAFEKGADGVYIVGCLEGDCRFKTGNLRAKKRVEQAKKLLEFIGIGEERVGMYNLSSGEGPKFAQFATEMDENIRKIGPNPLKQGVKKQAA